MNLTGRVNKAEVENFLREHGVRPSIQRVAVMEYLANHRTHPTIDDIYKALHPTVSILSRTTIYNTLHLLAGLNAVKEINIEENVCHYDADTSNHAHYRCKKCGKIFDLFETDVPLLAEIEKMVQSDSKFDAAELYFYGVCPKCVEKSEKKKQQK